MTSQDPGCLPGCLYQVQRARDRLLGLAGRELPPGARTAGVELVRSGPVAAATYGHTAGGAQDATSMLFLSGDGGASWPARQARARRARRRRRRGRHQGDRDRRRPLDQRAVRPARGPRRPVYQQTMTSTDGGPQLHRAAGQPGRGRPSRRWARRPRRMLLASLDRLYRSTDGGPALAAGRREPLPSSSSGRSRSGCSTSASRRRRWAGRWNSTASVKPQLGDGLDDLGRRKELVGLPLPVSRGMWRHESPVPGVERWHSQS